MRLVCKEKSKAANHLHRPKDRERKSSQRNIDPGYGDKACKRGFGLPGADKHQTVTVIPPSPDSVETTVFSESVFFFPDSWQFDT